MIRVALLGVLLVPTAQSDDFQKRVRLDGSKVMVDGRVLYDGPWKQADVAVRDFPAGENHAAWKHVVVTVDGQEKARIPLTSLEAGTPWPPVNAEELRPVIKRLTETVGGKKTLVLLVSTEKADFEVFRGDPAETRVERFPDAFVVYYSNRVVYRAAKPLRPPLVPADVLSVFNEHRVRSKLPRVRHSAILARGADLHALYLSKNDFKGLSGHEEDPKGAGYTEEGARAGKRSVISPFAPHETALDGVESLMATLYHRVSMMQPSLTEVGIGWAFRRDGLGFLVIDVGATDAKHDPKLWPVLYPAPGQSDVPVEFGLGARENPNPLPDGVTTAGYPITVMFPEKVEKLLDLDAGLTANGRDVPCWVSTPDRPARSDWPQPGVLCLIPKEKLKPGTTYTARFRYRDSGAAREWSFVTQR
jgi:Cysteine-rich secretory protein family